MTRLMHVIERRSSNSKGKLKIGRKHQLKYLHRDEEETFKRLRDSATNVFAIGKVMYALMELKKDDQIETSHYHETLTFEEETSEYYLMARRALVEACLQPEHEDSVDATLLWKGITRYIERTS